MNTYRVTLNHEHGYTVTVSINARDEADAKAQACTMHPGSTFVSAERA